MFQITDAPIDSNALLAAVSHDGAGAELLFLGVVRNNNLGRNVDHLVYEAYAPMAERALAGIGDAVKEKHGAEVRCAIAHRTGRLEIGEASVVIAVSAPHRDLCYKASRDAIELLKREVPVWKKEIFEGGEAWVEGPGS
ncbi:MAG: molybdenum cofactor biosynthesis protein MoaE [Planctomycetota bacterium]